jgi:hypothetical protein
MAQSQIPSALYDLGVKMKRYVQFFIFAIIIAIVAAIIFISALFSAIESTSTGEPVTVDFVFTGALLFLLIIMIFIGIWGLVRFFQYIGSLKNAALATGDPNLEKGYRYQIYAIAISIITTIGTVIFVLVLIGTSMANSQAFFDVLMPSFFMIQFIIIIAAIAPVILNILAYIALYDWAQHLSFYLQNYNGHEIEQGFNFMKWGIIIGVIFGWAFILVLIGMNKAATGLINQYGPQGPITPSPYGYNAHGPYGTPHSYSAPTTTYQGYTNTSVQPGQPIQMHTNITPRDAVSQNSQSNLYCNKCGTKLPPGEVKFCPQCGFQLK